ncbi:Fe-S cluster assembly protein SufD [Estrella lausannensis]|uniref:FeS assembly protein SufD n=1 Tax=Estrella lausannensis TaxID=483423 RepID=A0A0H5DMZ5_9BACT|nr:Fe-S cluster assembly protein SufD [Estrella lausannensis]CRX37392.1 FeS assembly protein SufD [Estrella lausannensis]
MTMETAVDDAFLQATEAIFEESRGSDFLSRLKDEAFTKFLELGLPSRKNEDFKYVKLKPLYARKVQPSFPVEVAKSTVDNLVFSECEGRSIVFVNGHFREELSNTARLPKGTMAMPLLKSARTFNSFFANEWSFLIKEEANPFYLLNTSVAKDGVFIYVPPCTKLDGPIQCLFIYDEASVPMLMQPRLSVFVGAGSEINLQFTHSFSAGKGQTVNAAADFHLEKGAIVRCEETTDEVPEQLYLFKSVRAKLKRDASFTMINTSKGAMTERSDYKVWLQGENSEASLDGLAMLSGKRESHTHIMVIHEGKHTRSRQLFKNVLKDFGRSSFEGQIIVDKEAMKTDAFQLNNNLLLSERCQADSKPMLKIYADDVKASHGATVGRLDEEQLFYLRSRGLSLDKAKEYLTTAFCKEVVDLLSIPKLRESILGKPFFLPGQ